MTACPAEVLPGVLCVREAQREFEDMLAILTFSLVRWASADYSLCLLRKILFITFNIFFDINYGRFINEFSMQHIYTID